MSDLLRSLLNLFVAQVAPIVVNFAVTFLTAAWLGPADRGVVAATITLATILGIVLSGSLHIGVNRLSTDGENGVKSSTIVAGTISSVSIVFGVILIVAQPNLYGAFNSQPWSLGAATICHGLFAFNLTSTRVIQVLGAHKRFRQCWVTQSLVYAAIALPAAYLSRSPEGVVIGWGASLLVGSLWAAPKLVYFHRRIQGDPVTAFRLLRVSWKGHVGAVGYQAVFRLDTLCLGIFATATAVGWYSIAASIAGLLWILAEAFALAAFASDRGRSGNGASDDEEWSRLARRDAKLIRINARLSVPGGLLLGLACAFLIPRLLPDYLESIPLVWILLAGVVVQGPSRVAYASLARIADLSVVLRLGGLGLLLSLLYVPTAMAFGVVGVAWTSTIIYCLHGGVTLFVWHRLSRPKRLLGECK